MLTVGGIERYDLINNVGSDMPAYTIWFSGCDRRCKGCHNIELWDKNNGIEYSANSLEGLIRQHKCTYGLHDVVFLGGEPLDQDIYQIKSLIKQLYEEHKLHIWLYTSYDIDEVEEILGNDYINMLYTIKCGAYDESKKQDGVLSSSNQSFYRQAGDCWKIINL